MNESPRETAAIWIGVLFTMFPAMFLAGFMPDWNVLPVAGWVAIAAIGSCVAGAIATPYAIRGAISGTLAGVGAVVGLLLYVAVRTALTESPTFFKIELMIGMLLGAAPGLVLYNLWARQSTSEV